ncbi:glycoprotein-N-acetylgalactosamine 3-beta-galactosyltransferase 1-like isoform X2 [Mercenaria mercenaria]|uniref:glycoprotein-N-acetylgalactosamine 3-beta-galactosyltransferase 1-like isoform X2 n=1 Tax=Mercenaria mercenaria TaxID=6596 RepID=UPI00234F70EC|nr:glycoprotein-N-acetylgalactosamine 3-beta-galactosyltransferase 1-like isoform X2 [Mercenaria mercenaria]
MQVCTETHSKLGLDTSFIKSGTFRKQLFLAVCTAIVVLFLILMDMFPLIWKTQGKGYYAKPSLKCTNNSKSTIRVLCLILASAYKSRQMAAIENTWAKRCDKYLFINGQTNNPQIAETILNVPVLEERRHLTMKMRHAFKYVYRAYKGSFDWILKCDTDTYVVMENLRNLLSHVDPFQPGYLGFHMKAWRNHRYGYMSGGGGYAISWQGFHQLIHKGFKNGCGEEDGSSEDLNIGLCLGDSDVPVLNSRDKDGKETFHPANIQRLLRPPHPRPIRNRAWNKVRFDLSFYFKTGREARCKIYQCM